MSARPFVKIAGGKTQLLPRLLPLLPKKYGKYREPFVGGGALFFAIREHWMAVLADVNSELVNVYRAVRDEVDELIATMVDPAMELIYDRERYYEIRALDPQDMSPVRRAARTLYLNKTGFNGLYRVNSDGKFNVPFGKYTNPTICDEENLRACSAALRGVDVRCQDFEQSLAEAGRGDLVYLDPPYAPASKTSNFTGYSAGRFQEGDQRRLFEAFGDLTRRGVMAMISNSDVPLTRELSAGLPLARVVEVSARRSINSSGGKRGKVGEILVLNYDPARSETFSTRRDVARSEREQVEVAP